MIHRIHTADEHVTSQINNLFTIKICSYSISSYSFLYMKIYGKNINILSIYYYFCIVQYSWARIFRRLFPKRCVFGSKSGTKSFGKSISGQILKNGSRAFEGLSYLAYKILFQLICICLFIFFIHIIQIALFCS